MNKSGLSLLVAWGLVLAAPAWAQKKGKGYKFGSHLDPGTESCPAPGDIKSMVSAKLGYVPWDDAAPGMILVTVRKVRGEFEGRWGYPGALSEPITRANCRELYATLAWSIKLVLQEEPPRQPPNQPPAGPPAEPPERFPSIDEIEQWWIQYIRGGTVVAPPVVTQTVTSRPLSPPPFSVSVRLGAFAAVESAPTVTGGFNLGARMRWGRFSLGLESRVDLPAYDDVTMGRIRTYLVAGAVVPCFHHSWFSACANVTAGALTATGYRGLVTREDVLPFAAVGPRLEMAVPVHRGLTVGMYADFLFALYRAKLNLVRLAPSGGDPKEEVLWYQPPASAALGLQVAWRFF